METRAHYALIGAFALAVIAVGFFSVFWLSGGGTRPEGTHTYKVIFAGSIAGLGRGSFVLFNGVRVGEVTEINLMPQDPSHVYALISVDARVPVRADTKAELELSGFTGVQSVALSGGNVSAPILSKPADGGPPVIMADHSNFQDLLQAAHSITGQASDLLTKANKLLDDDAPPLNASIKNIQKVLRRPCRKFGRREAIPFGDDGGRQANRTALDEALDLGGRYRSCREGGRSGASEVDDQGSLGTLRQTQ